MLTDVDVNKEDRLLCKYLCGCNLVWRWGKKGSRNASRRATFLNLFAWLEKSLDALLWRIHPQ